MCIKTETGQKPAHFNFLRITMAFKLIVLCAALAVANAGYLGAPAVGVAYSAAPAVSQVHYSSPLVTYGAPLAAPAITSQSSNILRSFGNLGQVSTYSKTIDTPYSSVSKSDVRISNPGLQIAHAPAIAYSAAPAVSQVHYSSPLVSYGAPLTAAAPGAITSQSSNILRSFGNLGQVSTYSKTIDTPYSSVQKSDVRVSNPGIRITSAPTLSYAAPAAHAVHTVPAAVGVAYSAAPAVSHFTYSGSYGLNYGW